MKHLKDPIIHYYQWDKKKKNLKSFTSLNSYLHRALMDNYIMMIFLNEERNIIQFVTYLQERTGKTNKRNKETSGRGGACDQVNNGQI